MLKALGSSQQEPMRDWYLDFVTVDYTTGSYFPEVRLRERELNQSIEQLKKIEKYSKVDFDEGLLRAGIIREAWGIKKFGWSDFQYSAGMCLHVQNFQIQQITCKHVVPEPNSLKRFLKLNHIRVIFEGNRLLPSWMVFTLINNQIVIEGTPTEHDVGHLVVQVEDIEKFVLVEFYINI